MGKAVSPGGEQDLAPADHDVAISLDREDPLGFLVDVGSDEFLMNRQDLISGRGQGVLRTGRSVTYLPITTAKRAKGSSKVKLLQDGVRFFMIIIRIATLYSPMRVFLPVSFIMFALGLFRYIFTFVTEGRFTNMSALLFVSSVIIFMMSLISEQITQMRFERRVFPRAVRRKEPEPTPTDGR